MQGLKFTAEVSIKFQKKLQTKMIHDLRIVPQEDVTLYAFRLKNYLLQSGTTNVLNLLSGSKLSICNIKLETKSRIWSVYYRTLNNISRTANSLVGHH